MIFIFPYGKIERYDLLACTLYANGWYITYTFENSQSSIYFANEWIEFTCQWWWQSSIFHIFQIFFPRSQIYSVMCDILLWWATYQNAKKTRCEPKRYHIRINMFEYIWNLYIAILSYTFFLTTYMIWILVWERSLIVSTHFMDITYNNGLV